MRAGQLAHQLPRDPGEAPGVEWWGAQGAVDDEEHVGAGSLAELASGVGEEGLVATALGRPSLVTVVNSDPALTAFDATFIEAAESWPAPLAELRVG